MESALSIVPFPTKKLSINLSLQKTQEWQYALVMKTLLPINKPVFDIVSAMHYHWGAHNPKDIIPISPHFYLLQFTHENNLQYVLNEGPWLVLGQILLNHRFNLGMNIHTIPFDTYII